MGTGEASEDVIMLSWRPILSLPRESLATEGRVLLLIILSVKFWTQSSSKKFYACLESD